jgi:hypothetical protein
MSRGISVSVVSDYGQDNQAIGVRFPAEAADFSSSICVQSSPGAYPACCTMGTGCSLVRGKARPGRDAHHSAPSCVEVENEQELYFLSQAQGRSTETVVSPLHNNNLQYFLSTKRLCGV